MSNSKPLSNGYIKVKPGTLSKLFEEGYEVFENRMVDSNHDRYLIDSLGFIHPIHRNNLYAHGNAKEFILTDSGFQWAN